MTVTAANPPAVAVPATASQGNQANPANQPTTVGAYLRDLPPDRRVAMARVCSMIRRSARGVRESMRYGLAFYELDGPLFALESGKRHMSLYVAEQDVVVKHKDALPGVDIKRSFIKFSDLNRLPLDVVEKIVRDSVAARRVRATAGTIPTQADLLKLWSIKEEAATPPPPRQTISLKPTLPPPPPPEPILRAKILKSPAPAKPAKVATANNASAPAGSKTASKSAAGPAPKSTPAPAPKAAKPAPKSSAKAAAPKSSSAKSSPIKPAKAAKAPAKKAAARR
ncbi:MAG: DUF1801 domain-containing protein [Burkholderiaceae bacterium]|nr:DUF1801 domain-containing protein [Burkholderiaceae bacterium]